MLTIPHMLAGAALGSLVPDSNIDNLLAFGIGWMSHYALDSIPHWERVIDSGEGKVKGFATDLPPSKWPRIYFWQAVADVILALTIVLAVIYGLGGERPFWESTWFWGALGGFFPDAVDNNPYVNRYVEDKSPWRWFNRFHKTIHISPESQKNSPRYLGLWTQLVVIGLSLWILG